MTHLSLDEVEAKSSANLSKRNYTCELPTTLYTVMNRHGEERHSVSESSESESEDRDQEEENSFENRAPKRKYTRHSKRKQAVDL